MNQSVSKSMMRSNRLSHFSSFNILAAAFTSMRSENTSARYSLKFVYLYNIDLSWSISYSCGNIPPRVVLPSVFHGPYFSISNEGFAAWVKLGGSLPSSCIIAMIAFRSASVGARRPIVLG